VFVSITQCEPLFRLLGLTGFLDLGRYGFHDYFGFSDGADSGEIFILFDERLRALPKKAK